MKKSTKITISGIAAAAILGGAAWAHNRGGGPTGAGYHRARYHGQGGCSDGDGVPTNAVARLRRLGGNGGRAVLSRSRLAVVQF